MKKLVVVSKPYLIIISCLRSCIHLIDEICSHFIRNSSVLDEESSSLTSVTSSRHLQRPIVQIYLYSAKIASYLPRQSSMKSLNGITERPQSKIEICTMSGSATLSPLLSYRIIKCSGTIAIRIAIAVLRVFSIL